MKTKMKIWCLFSVRNEYDQPDNNLEAWWVEKPSLETVAHALELTFPAPTDAQTLAVVKVWSGEEQTIGSAAYRLSSINEGVLKKEG